MDRRKKQAEMQTIKACPPPQGELWIEHPSECPALCTLTWPCPATRKGVVSSKAMQTLAAEVWRCCIPAAEQQRFPGGGVWMVHFCAHHSTMWRAQVELSPMIRNKNIWWVAFFPTLKNILLVYSWLTILCGFQVYSEVHLSVYLSPLSVPSQILCSYWLIQHME